MDLGDTLFVCGLDDVALDLRGLVMRLWLAAVVEGSAAAAA